MRSLSRLLAVGVAGEAVSIWLSLSRKLSADEVAALLSLVAPREGSAGGAVCGAAVAGAAPARGVALGAELVVGFADGLLGFWAVVLHMPRAARIANCCCSISRCSSLPAPAPLFLLWRAVETQAVHKVSPVSKPMKRLGFETDETAGGRLRAGTEIA